MINVINYFWIFVFGSFIGCFVETIWCIIKNRRYESRKGLIYGYFIPIYGIAAVLISFVFSLFQIKNFFSFFVITFLICALVEYISSYFQEKCFGTKSWDYSKMFLNINGRINVLYLLFFSVLGVFWGKYYNVILHGFINFLDNLKLLNIITILFLFFMIYNCIISILASYRQKMRKKKVRAKNKLEAWIDQKYNDEFMKKVYANAKFVE